MHTQAPINMLGICITRKGLGGLPGLAGVIESRRVNNKQTYSGTVWNWRVCQVNMIHMVKQAHIDKT